MKGPRRSTLTSRERRNSFRWWETRGWDRFSSSTMPETDLFPLLRHRRIRNRFSSDRLLATKPTVWRQSSRTGAFLGYAGVNPHLPISALFPWVGAQGALPYEKYKKSKNFRRPGRLPWFTIPSATQGSIPAKIASPAII